MEKDPNSFDEPEFVQDKTDARSPIGLVEPLPARSSNELRKNEVVAERFKVLSLIGRGAMGTVYLVEQLSIQKHVALKVLNDIAASPVNVRRFQNEALAASKLDHVNIVRALDYGWIGDQPFTVMDLVSGPTLAQHLKRKGSLPASTVYQIFIPICFALAHAHHEGVIHRDLKPSNIVLASDPHNSAQLIPKIVDFGIAKLRNEEEDLTRTGEVFGTPLYMSPEQCLGLKVDNRSDIYSLGCVLYETLTGAPPFRGQTALETMLQHKESNPLPLKEAALGADMPVGMQQIVDRMLEKDPSRRYQNCLDIAQDLTFLQQGRSHLVKQSETSEPGSKTRAINRRVGTMVGVALVCLVGAVSLWRFLDRPAIDVAATNKLPASTSDLSDGTKDGGSISTAARDSGTITSEPGAGLFDLNQDHYSQIKNGKREFNFGKRNIGTISVMQNPIQESNEDVRPAVGLVKFAKDKYLLLDVNVTEVHDDPSVFGRFSADDLTGLKIHNQGIEAYTGSEFVLDSALAFASKLTALQYLKLEGHLTINGLENMHIERMRLRNLNISGTDIDGKDLDRFKKTLRQLYAIDISNLKNVSKVLKCMQNSTNLSFMSVEKANLSSQDVGLIASMTNLKSLDLTGNRIINDQALSKFAHLDALQNLYLMGTNVTPACSKELAKCMSLAVVYLPIKCQSSEKKIRADLPRVHVEFKG